MRPERPLRWTCVRAGSPIPTCPGRRAHPRIAGHRLGADYGYRSGPSLLPDQLAATDDGRQQADRYVPPVFEADAATRVSRHRRDAAYGLRIMVAAPERY